MAPKILRSFTKTTKKRAERDLETNSQPKCSLCKENIAGEIVKVPKKNPKFVYHPDCYECYFPQSSTRSQAKARPPSDSDTEEDVSNPILIKKEKSDVPQKLPDEEENAWYDDDPHESDKDGRDTDIDSKNKDNLALRQFISIRSTTHMKHPKAECKKCNRKWESF